MFYLPFQGSYVIVSETKSILQIGLILEFISKGINVKWPTAMVLRFFNRKVFSSVKRSVPLLEEL